MAFSRLHCDRTSGTSNMHATIDELFSYSQVRLWFCFFFLHFSSFLTSHSFHQVSDSFYSLFEAGSSKYSGCALPIRCLTLNKHLIKLLTSLKVTAGRRRFLSLSTFPGDLKWRQTHTRALATDGLWHGELLLCSGRAAFDTHYYLAVIHHQTGP